MADLQEFRESVRSWLEANSPKSLRGKMRDPNAAFWGGKKTKPPYPDSKAWLNMMADKGWTIPFWPKEYGGGGLDKEETKVLNEELARLELPPPLTGFGITMIGPTILQYGTEEQKKLYIPQICKGEIRWCQGYSEPNAGSDLANVQLKAVSDGDYWVLNGQKTWTSYGDLADWMFLLVRTNTEVKKQAGITFMLTDLDIPGVEIRPIKLISGASPFCEVFFEEVRVPKHQILNRIDGGWEVARALLGHERTMIANTFGGRQTSAEVKENPMEAGAKKYIGLKDGKLADDAIRQRMAQNQIDEQSFLLTVQRNGDNVKAGHRPGPETSIFKVYGTELNQRRQELMLSIFGPECLGWEGDGFEKSELDLTRVWLRSRGNTLEGGSSEIQLNIIAKQVLGLPD